MLQQVAKSTPTSTSWVMLYTIMNEATQSVNRIDKLTWAWGIISALLMATGYLVYITWFLAGDIAPNGTSWGLWGFGGLIEAVTFTLLVWKGRDKESELALAITPFVCAMFALIIAGIGIFSGQFEPLTRWDWIIVVADVAVVVMYVAIRLLDWAGRIKDTDHLAERVTNGLLIADIFLSFLPIWTTTWLEPTGERILPWGIWTGSYLLLGLMGWIQIHKHWKKRKWLVFYPFASAVFHGAVGIIVLVQTSA